MVAILPLAADRRAGLTVTRFLGHGVGDQLGPVCEPGELPTAIGVLSETVGRGLLMAERLPAGTDWAAELGGRLIKRDDSPVIDLVQEGSWEQYLAARSANFRQQVRRRARRLEGGLEVRFRLTEDPGRVEQDLETLFALHDARWANRSHGFSAAEFPFHRDFAAAALERGWLRLWVAEAQGTPVAAWYGFRFAGADCYYQAGRDPSWDRAGIGVGLLEHTIRDSFAAGMREYRLLRGGEDYKSRYATRNSILETVLSGRGVTARLLISAAPRLVALRRRLLTA